MLLCIPLTPPELERKPCKQARFGAANSSGSGVHAVLLVLVVGGVPQVGHHVDHHVVQLETLRIDLPVALRIGFQCATNCLVSDVDLRTCGLR